MEDNIYDKTRRDFIKLSSLAAFALHPTVSALARWLKVDKKDLDKCFHDDEFHYFGNNLTNLHFYFINAKIEGKRLNQLPKTSAAFMVVKIPQQHVQEQLLREKSDPGKGGFDPDYINSGKRTESKISGFSFLAFKLFPTKVTVQSRDKVTTTVATNRKLFVDLSDINNLLNWNNSTLYELLIPTKEDYKSFKQLDWDTFRDNDERLINDNENKPSKDYICKLYKSICDEVFIPKKEFFPLTLLEIPEGLLVTPYSQDGQRPLADTYRIPKARFVYNSIKGKVVRTVEEIWSAQLFFDTAEGRQSPPLRGVGYIPRGETKPLRDKDECPKDPTEEIIYLPTLLDKNEIVYLTSLGREVKEGKEWNIETRGLTLTGLGVIAKFHYKNFTPPTGSALAEYEHHFSLGRDEYIKVARIGVISVTGQKALHVKIGQRKIKNGTSYMEFKEYIEIIQKEISYFANNLFIKDEPNKKEPYNYIQARNYPPSKNEIGIIHSYDDVYDGNTNTIDTNDVWIDKAIWKQNILPEKWNTHYKRWAFVKINSVKSVTPPIVTTKNDVKPDTIINCGECTPNNPLAFWPILETDKTDVYLDFKGLDWDNKEILFSSTFLFIRKSLIEEKDETKYNNCINEIYKNFFREEKKERRLIRFIDSEIAYTSDYSSKSTVNEEKGELPNKSNVAKTDFIEYYFSLCKEPIGQTLKFEANKINSTGPTIPTESIFNERLFPLFPQIKRAQLYIENIQSYTPEPLPSIVEYNEDFINYGYEGKVSVTKKDGAVVDVIYNKARLVFNHTDKFRSNEENVLEQINGEWRPKTEAGYSKIKQAFSGAGSAIGGLVNPDFDIQSIGLIKQSIAVGKDINKKYEQVTEFTDKIKKFNPSDLLRQAPEIFNGISLIDILQGEFPEYEAPINDIKNIASQVEQLNDTLLSGLDELKKIINDTKRDLLDLKNKGIESGNDLTKWGYQSIQTLIDNKELELTKLRDRLNLEYQFSDLSNLIDSVQSYSSLIGLEYNKITLKINPDDIKIDELSKSISNKLLANLEIILKLKTDISIELSEKIKSSFPELKTHLVSLDTSYKVFLGLILKDVSMPSEGLIPFEDFIVNGVVVDGIIKKIQTKIKPQIANYIKFSKVQLELDALKSKLINGEIKEVTQKVLTEYKTAKENFEKPLNEIRTNILEFKKIINELIAKNDINPNVFQNERDRIKSEIQFIESKITTIYELILFIEIPYIIESFEKAKKEYEIAKSKIGQIDEITRLPKISITDLEKLILSRNEIETAIENKRNALITFLNSKAFKSISLGKDIDLNKVINSVNKSVNDLEDVYKESIKTIWLNIAGVKELHDTINKIEKELYKNPIDNVDGYKELLQKKSKQYESKLKEQLSQEANGVIDLLKKKIEAIENQIISEPDREDLRNLLIQSKQLYNTLTSLSKKEINYTWQTSSFKNADFGIVSFLASNNPKTSLSVNVRNTIYFQPNKFPAVIQKIDSIAENRLNNFGISLLKAIIINFNEVSFVAGTNQSPKFEVKIRDVQFAGAFSFVQALESIFKKLLGDNFSVKISPQQVDIEYLLPIAYIGAPSFGFKDILFRIIYTLYFNKKPMELGVGIGSPENRTKLSVGIYTGLFYFIVIGNPKQGITTIEVSIEFGGYFGLSLGPLRGEVKLVVGLYYRKDQSGVTIEGYFLCEGRVKLWFIMITARFYMGVRSKGGYVEGRCTVSYEIRLGRFFKRSFTANYYKKVAGASPGNNVSGNNQKYLDKYNLKTLTNPLERMVSPLTRYEWSIFINSYID